MSGNGRFERFAIVCAVTVEAPAHWISIGSRIASGRERSRPATLDGRDSARCGICDVRLLVVRGARTAVGGPFDAPRLPPSSCRKRFRRAFPRVSHRDDLPGDGMLLQWNGPGRHPIWMAGMRFPLDLIWLEQDGRGRRAHERSDLLSANVSDVRARRHAEIRRRA
jgi:hypothetical protein